MLCETCHNESASGIRCNDCGVLLCPACFKNHYCQAPPPLWAHQERGLADLQKAIDKGEKSLCVVAPCGGGKTRMMCEQSAIDVIRGKRVTIYTNRKLLRAQTSRKFDEHGIEHGIMAAGHQPALLRDVQVASIQTVHSRVIQRQKWELHDSDIIMVDECHANKADTAQEIIKRHKETGAVIVGWTATPVSISHIYDRLIVAGTKSELRKCGALVPCLTFGPDEPDMHGVKRNQVGEYSVGDITKRIHMQTIFGRVYPHWQRLNPDGRATILFAPGVAESKWFVEQFNRVGVSAAHIDADTSDAEREDIIEGSKDGHVKIISNRYVCREGVDLPWLTHCIFATVFGALSSFLQAGGRLLRAYPGIEKVCLQCHGGSFHRFGSLNQDRVWKLGDTDVSIHNAQQKRRRGAKEREPICCPKCGGIRMSGPVCPFCGHQHKRSVRRVIQLDGTLKRQVGNVTKHKRQVSSEQAAWDKCFYRALYSWMTFDQAVGLYRRENGRAVPMGLQNMPSAESVDWQRKVRDVYPNRVRRKKAVH